METKKRFKDDKMLNDTLDGLGYSKHQKNMLFQQMEDLRGLEAITFSELKEMDEEELKNLTSYCWRDGDPRCGCKGVSDLKIELYETGNNSGQIKIVNWSDSDGDPTIDGPYPLSKKIHKLGDGTWNYGLYREKKV